MSDLRAKFLVAVLLALGGTAVLGGWACSRAEGGSTADLTEVDASVRPGDDFYGYANNRWMRGTALPEGMSRTDTTAMLRVKNADRVRGLISAAAAAVTAPDGGAVPAETRKVGDYYLSRLDRTRIDALGLKPIEGELAAIAAIADRRGLAVWLGGHISLDDGGNARTESLLGIWIHQGFHDGRRHAVHLVQGGLGLGEPGDYLDPGADSVARREMYRAHVAETLRAAGFDRAEARAARVLELEIAIAATHASREFTDTVSNTDNAWSRADFAAKAPGMAWDAYFAAAGLGQADSFVVWQPQAVTGAARLAANAPLPAWRDYLAFHLIEHYAEVLPTAISDGRRAFEARLTGAAPAPGHVQLALAATETALSDAVGRMYVERYFPPRAKAVAQEMVANLKQAWRERLDRVAWMSAPTRAKAIAKLDALGIDVGYPARWTDYAGLVVRRGDALGNQRRAEAFAYRRELAKLNRPVDPNEWNPQIRPQMAGAFLNISPNSMEFAAGILQPPYFDYAGDAASNYGSAGAGIAHEIGHSFDELGNQYDAEGRLGLWWTPEDLAGYRAATAPFVAQLDQCCPTPDACAHGRQILAESALDLAGLEVAHAAYVLSLHGRPDVVLNGLTGDQRFYVAFAQRWRRLQTDAALRRQVETDSHAPPSCRSHLARNLDGWVEAFGVRPGDALYLAPERRLHVW